MQPARDRPAKTDLGIKWLIVAALLGLGLAMPPDTSGEGAPAESQTNSPFIRSVTVNGQPVVPRRGVVNLGTGRQSIAFSFVPSPSGTNSTLRMRYRLDGFDTGWREAHDEMSLSIRFFSAVGDQVGQKNPAIFNVSQESDGWTGSLKTSPLRHRRETLTAPPLAARVWVTISSAGSQASVGTYVVANLVISRHSDGGPLELVMESPTFNADTNRAPRGWIRDGYSPSMAKIVSFGQSPEQSAFAIMDDNAGGHAEWHNIMDRAGHVSPGDQLLVEWNEMYSIGTATTTNALYQNLGPGNYEFQVAQFDVLGNQIGEPATIAVVVPISFWRQPWFWSLAATALVGVSVVGARYAARRKVRLAIAHLTNQQTLERERLRIAQDIHDDLGARITEISLASAMAQKKQPLSAPASADFERISGMCRELISALYETVWAVNPENDNLDALGSYLCQMVNQLCEQAELPCRLQIADLPRGIQVSSQTRHNIIMAVKEAIHNVIKHARATEVRVDMSFAANALAIRVHDNGVGMPGVNPAPGHGLSNMKHRLTDIGGDCTIESHAGGGTLVSMHLVIPLPEEPPA